jgi:hypothetical protein
MNERVHILLAVAFVPVRGPQGACGVESKQVVVATPNAFNEARRILNASRLKVKESPIFEGTICSHTFFSFVAQEL